MIRVFAILQEPASYTVDRNRAVYDKLGIDYCYINNTSEAKSGERKTDCLSNLNDRELHAKLNAILSNYDIVIMNGYTGKVFRCLYKLNKHHKRIIGIDSDTQLRIPGNPVKRLVKWMWLSTVFRNKHYYGLAGGSSSHKDLFRYYGMKEQRICLMPMMVNNEKFTRKETSPCKEAGFRFLYVGRIIEVKNIPVMLDAFVKAFGNCGDVELRVVGKGELLDCYKNKYKQFSNIDFAGPKYGDELVREYHQASVFVLPSLSEPWGLVVNEAMAAGLPVIVSNQVGAAHDLVEGHDSGFIFPYAEVDKLSECMQRLVNDKELYDKYASNATDFMKNHWNYDLYTKCLLDFINKASSEK
ncbi:MAG: glycosyltransferase family 4 protein [Bacteroides sp.]|nr:glycosyltransferase family 4 protein [Bacteroides sp.]